MPDAFRHKRRDNEARHHADPGQEKGALGPGDGPTLQVAVRLHDEPGRCDEAKPGDQAERREDRKEYVGRGAIEADDVEREFVTLGRMSR